MGKGYHFWGHLENPLIFVEIFSDTDVLCKSLWLFFVEPDIAWKTWATFEGIMKMFCFSLLRICLRTWSLWFFEVTTFACQMPHPSNSLKHEPSQKQTIKMPIDSIDASLNIRGKCLFLLFSKILPSLPREVQCSSSRSDGQTKTIATRSHVLCLCRCHGVVEMSFGTS